MRVVCCWMLNSLAEWLIKQIDDRPASKPLPKWTDGATTAVQFLQTHPDATAKLLRKHFEKPEYLDCYPIVADYLIENTLLYFRDKLQKAYDSGNAEQGSSRRRQGKNDTVFNRLGKEFSMEEARREKTAYKGAPATDDEAKQMIKNWKYQGMIESIGVGKYRKL